MASEYPVARALSSPTGARARNLNEFASDWNMRDNGDAQVHLVGQLCQKAG